MTKQQIPDREPIGDAFSGIISRIDNHHILSISPLTSADPIAEGDFVIRYGVIYLGKPHHSIVPDLVVVDYGDMLVGEDAWNFLTKQSNLYPRADVLGYRNDGRDEMLVVKQLDLVVPFDVFAYTSDKDRTPIAKLTALIAPENDTYPERLLKHLPCYDTIADWQTINE
jgi:hypothetical protein